MKTGDIVMYKPVNCVNGVPKTDHMLYGKKGYVKSATNVGLLDHQLLWLEFEELPEKEIYATSKEVEIFKLS